MVCVTQNKKFANLCNITRKVWGMKLIFLPADKCKRFLQDDSMCVARHAQSTQNNKFAKSLQYLKEHRKDEVNFLPVGKRDRFLQIDIIM